MASLYGGARDSWGQKRIPKLCFVSLFERTTIPLGRKSSSDHTVGEQEHSTYPHPHSRASRSMIEPETQRISARMQRTAHSAQRAAHSTQSITQHYIVHSITRHYKNDVYSPPARGLLIHCWCSTAEAGAGVECGWKPAGRGGWGLQSCPISGRRYSASGGRGPAGCGGLCFDATAQATLPVHGTRPAGRGEIFPTRPATLPCVDSNPPWPRTPCRVLSPSGPRGAEPAIRLMQVSLASMAATVKLTSRT